MGMYANEDRRKYKESKEQTNETAENGIAFSEMFSFGFYLSQVCICAAWSIYFFIVQRHFSSGTMLICVFGFSKNDSQQKVKKHFVSPFVVFVAQS